MTPDEFNEQTIRLEKEKLQLERQKMALESRFMHRHFGAILGGAVSLVAIVVSVAQVWTAYINSQSQIANELIQQTERRQQAEKERIERAQFELGKFASGFLDDLYGSDLNKRDRVVDIITASFPAEASAPFINKLARTVEPGTKASLEARNLNIVATIAPRIYLHIQQAGQRRRAKDLAEKIESEGYVVPGVQLVSSGPKLTQLRVFKATEVSEARSILEGIQALGISVQLIDLSEEYNDSPDIRPRHYELWLGSGY
ncbi:MAG: hypothetical protein KZQ99_19070 [Candidatus Thiodiazotropha sp. (ex Dulcina madagascariensis)]|nr:hypothetical protein [Candidatus Thiodiazotropha sp. (ex Dulcina madagascariensis)]